MLEFNKYKANKTYGKTEIIDSKKKGEDINDDDIHETITITKGKANKVYEINVEEKRLSRERREKARQNTKDRHIEKANAKAVLQACTTANKAFKTNQDISTMNNAAEYEDDMDDINLFLNPPSKAKYSGQIKTSSKCNTVHTEPLLGESLPGSQATRQM